MMARALAAVARIISGARARWLHPPSDARQRIFYANHSSHLDFVVIWASLPPAIRSRARPVAGADYWDHGRIRRYLSRRVFNAILVERSTGTHSPADATRTIQHIADEMGTEYSIIVFPEGTRSLDGEMHGFKSGIYHLARLKPDVELVPVYLANMNRILPKGEVVPVPLLGRVVAGEPLRLGEGEDKDAFLSRARDALLQLRDM